MTIDQARGRVRGIGYFLLIASTVMFVASLIAVLNSGGDTNLGSVTAIDYAIASPISIAVAIAIVNYSRAGAVVLAILYLTDILEALPNFDLLEIIQITIKIVILSFLIPAIFVYHKKIKENNFKIGGIAFFRWSFVAIAAIILPLIGFGAYDTHFGIGTAVVDADHIRPSHVNWIKENNLLLEGEEILELYSYGFLSIAEDGNILTSTHVGSWWRDNGEIIDSRIPHAEVCGITLLDEGNFFDPASYQIDGVGDDNWILLYLSIEDDGHERFISKLEDLAVNLGGEGPDNPCAEGGSQDDPPS